MYCTAKLIAVPVKVWLCGPPLPYDPVTQPVNEPETAASDPLAPPFVCVAALEADDPWVWIGVLLLSSVTELFEPVTA